MMARYKCEESSNCIYKLSHGLTNQRGRFVKAFVWEYCQNVTMGFKRVIFRNGTVVAQGQQYNIGVIILISLVTKKKKKIETP